MKTSTRFSQEPEVGGVLGVFDVRNDVGWDA